MTKSPTYDWRASQRLEKLKQAFTDESPCHGQCLMQCGQDEKCLNATKCVRRACPRSSICGATQLPLWLFDCHGGLCPNCACEDYNICLALDSNEREWPKIVKPRKNK
jgi:hypothetical protein